MVTGLKPGGRAMTAGIEADLEHLFGEGRPRGTGGGFSELTQHSACGSMLGCHRTPFGLRKRK